ncbi:S-layer homology domain-containing protein [Flavonifractor sp. AGMB03687]|uniref:S-layer homology domain-containing protein n=1 Tax=Flavonifractor sp. AGMB03687 TaxID=2785133 RepID=UPI001AE07DD1|nr:S-layer homology domain-containing protein [Flavonifractor sp. AGMB03687]
MRNLKRVLSLALAALMLMGMMVVGAGAASKDFTDADEITNVEAVDVMVALGVLEGGDKGDFQPNSILTREQAAKIICYLLLGSDSAEKLTTNYSIFSDVPANRWSAPYISYCVNLGILAGDGNGHFYPEGKLTGVAFAKMLMVALGYNAERENFIGNNWEINVSARAIETGIAPKGLVLSEELSRQDAAQMSFNTLKATMVEYQNDTTIIVGGTTVSTASKATPVAQGNYTNTMGTENLQFAEKNFPDLKKIADTDAFERPATTWRNGNTVIGTYADAADVSYTSSVKIGTIYNDLGLTKGISKKDVSLYVDGASASWSNDIVKGETTKVGGNGALTEVYYDADNGEATVIVTNTYVAKIAAARSATSTKDAYVVLNVSDAFTGPGGNYETEQFAKGDIVYYTYSYKNGEKGIQSMELAEKATGKMTTYTTSGNVTVDGTKYEANTTSADKIANFVTTVDKGSEVSVYLDGNGYVLYVDADVEVNYAVVLNYTSKAGDWNDTAKAQLLFTDGTTKSVEVALGVDPTDSSKKLPVVDADSDGIMDDTVTGNKLNKYDIVSYTVDSDDVYTINLVADSQTAKAGGSFVMENGSNTFSIVDDNKANVAGGRATHYADGKTIFLVADTSAKKTTYSVYEGIANMPTIKHDGGTAGKATVFMNSTSNNNPATVVFVEKNARMSMASDNKDVIFVKGSNVGTSYTTDLGAFYEYDAYINGEATTIKVDTNNQMTKATLLYGPVYNNKGVLTGFEDKVNEDTATGNDGTLYFATTTDSVVNDVVKLGGIPYAYEKNCNVYFISVDGELTKSDITAITEDDNDQVFFKLSDKGRLTDVYVKVVDATEGVTPDGNYNMSGLVLRKTGSGSNFAVDFTSTDALTADMNVTITITKKNNNEGDALVGNKTLSAQPSAKQRLNTGIAIPAAGNYVAVVTVTNANGQVLCTGTTATTYVAQ